MLSVCLDDYIYIYMYIQIPVQTQVFHLADSNFIAVLDSRSERSEKKVKEI